MKQYTDFKRLYSLSKTLRFKLIPKGKTLDYIIEHGLIEQDLHRSQSYSDVKKIIDEYHKNYINNMLSKFKLKVYSDGHEDSLEEYYFFYMIRNKSPEQKKVISEIQNRLRKQIADILVSSDIYRRIDKKELIKEDLLNFVKNEQERKQVQEFKDFTTYFTGFYENRRNMYSVEAKATTIPYRLIHENLPRFVDNMNVYEKVAQSSFVSEYFRDIYSYFEEYMNVSSLDEVFKLDYYNIVLTQSQIDLYNAIIGGVVLENGAHIRGLNQYINQYNQSQKDKKYKLPKFKLLYKQILSDKDSVSWLPDEFDSDNAVLEAIQNFYNSNVSVFTQLKMLFSTLSDYDLEKIYLKNDSSLTEISHRVFGNWAVIQNAFIEYFIKNNPQRKRETNEKYNDRTKKFLNSFDALSIADVEKKLSESGISEEHAVVSYFENFKTGETDIVDQIETAYNEVKDILNIAYPGNRNLVQDKVFIEKIKRLLDSIKHLQHFVKPLVDNNKDSVKDARFYGEFTPLWEALDKITPLYNKVRNYVTRKPYSLKKFKLNFENSTLMDGWDLNKERDNTTVILRKDGRYYLGIMNKRFNRSFDSEVLPTDEPCYEKMIYKLLPGPNKMLPKVFFSKSRILEFAPSEEIMRIKNDNSFKKGDKFNVENCHKLIDFYKESINKHEDWKKFNFKFSETSQYNDMSEFFHEVEAQGYMVSFCKVSEKYVEQLVDEGKLYLFQIYNKDFSKYSKGRPNLHTVYWNMLFDERNLSDVVYKLNGEAEVFYRKASLTYNKPTHPANQLIKNKRMNAEKKESVFDYDLIKDKRFTIDQFEFHVPITINFKSDGLDNINQRVFDYIKDTSSHYVLGIDRGERHLLYLTLIDDKGRIVEGMQFSLNKIDDTDYHHLLEQREGDRQKARQSWQTIENIKELKQGYLSAVINQIAEIMVKYEAIVVMEDLNMGFKRGRQKVERQVYQKFEQMLINKLNFYVDKKRDVEEIGGALNGYQLTSKFDSYQKLGKQSGFLFYVPAWNTSKIDPVSGFANFFDTKYESVSKTKKELIEKIDDISYNKERDYFEFKIDYSKFTTRAAGTREKWTLCSYGDRIETFKNHNLNNIWETRVVKLTEEFKTLFESRGIDIHNHLKESVLEQEEKLFFYNDLNQGPLGFLQLFRLMLQLRNSVPNSEVDYIISPVADDNECFYDSRIAGGNLPQNADANGAYNIARKGLWIIKQIKKCNDLKDLRLAISNQEWLNYVQNKEYMDI